MPKNLFAPKTVRLSLDVTLTLDGVIAMPPRQAIESAQRYLEFLVNTADRAAAVRSLVNPPYNIEIGKLARK